MNIEITGAGPAGSYFAILMKRRRPAYRIRVIEQTAAEQTFGWGVVLSRATLAAARRADPESHEAILAHASEPWDRLDVVRGDERKTVNANAYRGIRRADLLKVLHQRLRDLGVELEFGAQRDSSDAGQPDLRVGADGARSGIREQFAHHFQPEVSFSASRYLWLGVTRRFDCLQMIFRRCDAGWLMAQAYPSGPSTSTFIVEASQPVLNASRFGLGENDLERLREIFAPDLQGHELMCQGALRWRRFPTVRCRCWSHDRVLLIGDALHTVHFSVGSGTKLAIEDAMALAAILEGDGISLDVSAVAARFERAKRPLVERYQLAAERSQRWFEQIERYIDLDLAPFTSELLLRTGLFDRRTLPVLAVPSQG